MSVPNQIMQQRAGHQKISKATQEELQPALRKAVSRAVDQYLKDMNGHDPQALYRLVLAEVEGPLLETVLNHAGGNQTRAADILGINRGTLRKKMKQYRLD